MQPQFIAAYNWPTSTDTNTLYRNKSMQYLERKLLCTIHANFERILHVCVCIQSFAKREIGP